MIREDIQKSIKETESAVEKLKQRIKKTDDAPEKEKLIVELKRLEYKIRLCKDQLKKIGMN